MKNNDIDINEYEKNLTNLRIYQEELEVQNEELKENEILVNKLYKKYFSLFNNSPLAYIVIDHKINVIEFNNKANLILNNTLQKFSNKIFSKYFKVKDYLKFKDWITNDKFEEQEFLICDLTIHKKTNKFKIYASNYDETENLYLLSLIDIQPEYDMMNSIEKLSKQKEEQNKLLIQQAKLAAVGEMLGNVAHQWKQPLNNLSMLISSAKIYLQSMFTQDSKKSSLIEENLEKSLSQIIFLSDTVNNFNKFFISQNVNEDHFNLITCINNIETFTFNQLKDNSIDLVLNLSNLTVYGNQNQLTQVLLNLLSNAKDALIQNQNENSRYIFIETSKINNQIEILVKDTAGGINENIIDKVFNKYFTTKDSNNGTGLGLNLAKKIIEEQFKGNIEVKNETFKYDNKDYKGAVFKITIPINEN